MLTVFSAQHVQIDGDRISNGRWAKRTIVTVFWTAVESYVLSLRSEAAAEVAVNCDRHFHRIDYLLLFCSWL